MLLSEVEGEELVIRQLMKNISMLNEDGHYEDVVEEILKLIDYRNSLKNSEKLHDIDQLAKRNISINLADRYLEDLVTGIASSYQSLLKFAYYLRKNDKNDLYTFNLLNGQVK